MLYDKETLLNQQSVFSRIARANWIALNNVRTSYFKVRVSADVTVTVAGTLIRNGGSVLGFFTRAGLQQGSQDQINMDLRMLRHLSEALNYSSLGSRRLSVAEVVAKGTFTLFDEVVIPCSMPGTISLSQTAFREQNPQNVLNVFFQQAPTDILTDGTFTVANLAITVSQVYDENIGERPVFVPFFDAIEFPVTASVPSGRIDLRASDYIAALLIQEDTANVGEVSDIITSFAYRGDGTEIIGPPQIPWLHMVDGQGWQSGAGSQNRYQVAGDTAGVPQFVSQLKSWLFYNHIKQGRLSGLLAPNTIANLRLEANAAPTAVAGATGSLIRVGRVMYRRDQVVCTPEIPFPVV